MQPHRPVFILLILISTFTCLAQIIDRAEFERLPSCATPCGLFRFIAAKCGSIASRSITPTAYDNCICTLGARHRPLIAENICGVVCNNTENVQIKQFFQVLCAHHGQLLTTPLDTMMSFTAITLAAYFPDAYPSVEIPPTSSEAVTSMISVTLTAQIPAELPTKLLAEPPAESTLLAEPPATTTLLAEATAQSILVAEPLPGTSAAVAAGKHISPKYWVITSILVSLFLLLAAWAVHKRRQQQPKPEGINRTIALDIVSSPSEEHLRGEGESDWPIYSFSMNNLDANNPYGASMASPVERPVPSYSWQICADPPRSAGTERSSRKEHGSKRIF